MFDLANYTTDKATKQLLLLMGVTVTGIIALHYVRMIQLNNLKIKKYQQL